MSLPEGLLWRELRKRPAGLKFRRQHPAGPFILDFVCLSARLAVEVDGEVHDSAGASVHDEARDAWLASQSYQTLRISAAEVLRDLDPVVRFIVDQAQCQPLHRASRGPPPRPGEE